MMRPDNDCRYLAIDPGNTPGWATFNEEGEATAFDNFKDIDDFLDWMEQEEVQPWIIILERYRSRPGQINAWSPGNTQQHIGAIKRAARKKNIPVAEQDPSPCLAQGLRFLGMYQMYYTRGKKNKHVPDKVSALAHGTWYLRKHGIQK